MDEWLHPAKKYGCNYSPMPNHQHWFSQSLSMKNKLFFKSSLTHWGRDKMAAISQTTFSNAFFWMKMYEFRLNCHWSLFLRVQLTISQHWFRWWLGAGQATSHCLNQCWLVYWRINASLGLNELSHCHQGSLPRWAGASILTHTSHVDIGLGNGLSPNVPKPLPVLTCHQ